MPVVVLAQNEERQPIQEPARTMVVNAHGGLLRMREHLHVGQSFVLQNPAERQIGCRVVRVEDDGMEFYKIAFEFEVPTGNFWPVSFPPADWAATPVHDDQPAVRR
jgi:hypothetical protein